MITTRKHEPTIEGLTWSKVEGFAPERQQVRLAFGVFLLAFVPTIPIVASYLWSTVRQPSFFYVPFLLFYCLLILHRRYRITFFVPSSHWGNFWRLGVIVSAAGILISASLLYSPRLFWLGLIWLSLPVFYQFRSKTDLRPALGPWALLWISLRPPGDYAERLELWAQSGAAEVSSVLLNLFGVLHLKGGNAIHLPEKSFLVVDICGGVVSPFAMLFLAGAIALYYLRSIFQAALLMIASLFWSWLINIFSIFVVVAGYSRFSWQWEQGWTHFLFAAAVLVFAFVLLLSTDRLLLLLLGPIYGRSIDDYPLNHLNPLVLLYNKAIGGSPRPWGRWSVVFALPLPRLRAFPRISFAALCLVLFAAGAIASTRKWQLDVRMSPGAEQEDPLGLRGRILPPEIGMWERAAFELREDAAIGDAGNYEAVWKYVALPVTAEVHCEYFVFSDEAPTLEYRNRGWELLSRRIISENVGEESDISGALEVVFEKPNGQLVVMQFSHFDTRGERHGPGDLSAVSGGLERGLRTFLGAQRKEPLVRVRTTFSSYSQPDEERKRELRRLHFAARHELIQHIRDETSGN